MSGYAQLPDLHDIQGDAEGARHLVSYGNAAAWKGEDQHVRPAGVPTKRRRQMPPRLMTISESLRHGDLEEGLHHA